MLNEADQRREASLELFVRVTWQVKFEPATEQEVAPLIRSGLAESSAGGGVGVGEGVGVGVGVAVAVGLGVGVLTGDGLAVGVLVGEGVGVGVFVGRSVAVGVAVVAIPVIVKFNEALRWVSTSLA